MDGYDRVKTPFGPTDCNKAESLIGKNILYATHKEGLGSYGILVSIHPNLPYPYKIKVTSPPFARTFHARWIVEHD